MKKRVYKVETVIKRLQAKFPKLDMATANDFYGYANEVNGVWFKNAAYDYGLDADETLYAGKYARNDLLKAVEKLGYFCEAYDQETIMAYPQ
jgi:hypothetical protein